MTQSTIVPSAPRVQLAVSCDGSAVRAPTSNLNHLLSRLFTTEGRDQCGLLQVSEVRQKSR